MIGRISRTELSEAARPRLSIEIDAVNVEKYTSGDLNELHHSPDSFFLIRMTSTPRKLAEVLGAEEAQLVEGAWLQLVIIPKRARGFNVQMAELGPDGYETVAAVSLSSGDYLYSDSPLELRPSPAGAAVRDALLEASSLADDCILPVNARRSKAEISAMLESVPKPHHIHVYDVGQASFAALNDETSNPLVFFDAGWPLVFNKRTVPPNFMPRRAQFVILSHWDFDHLLAFYKFRHLQNTVWIVPDQRVGPGARRIAQLLFGAGKLVIVNVDKVTCSWGEITRCEGAIGSTNDTGLALHVLLQSGRNALLVGDASYQHIPLPSEYRPHFLVATHHGAKFEGQVPSPFRPIVANPFEGFVPPRLHLQATCVVSVGHGNVYGHPKADAIRAHRSAGWNVIYTSQEGNLGTRGSRKLGP